MAGQGSVYRRCGCIDAATRRQLGGRCLRLADDGHGSWYIGLELPAALDGRRRRIRRGGYASSDTAEAVLNSLRVPAPGDPEAGILTVGDWLAHWLVSRAAPAASTLRSYTTHVRLLAAAAQASPDLPEVKEDPGALAAHIARLPGGEKDRLLILVARDQGARARMELLRGLGPDPDERRDNRPRRTVTKLLDAAAELRVERHRRAEAEAAARQARREREREAARQRRLDELATDPEAAWAKAGVLIATKVPARYDEAVTLLADLRDLAGRDGQAGEFGQRFAALREEHLRKPSLIARFDRAGLTA